MTRDGQAAAEPRADEQPAPVVAPRGEGAPGADSKAFAAVTAGSRPMLAFFRAVRITAAPLAVSAAAAAVFAFPAQMRDIYRTQAESFGLGAVKLMGVNVDAAFGEASFSDLLIGMASVWLLAVTLGAAAHYAIDRLAWRPSEDGAPAMWALRLAPTVAYLLPILGLTFGMYAAFEVDAGRVGEVARALQHLDDTERLDALQALGTAIEGLKWVLWAAAGMMATLGLVHAAVLWRLRRLEDRKGGPGPRVRWIRRIALGVVSIAVVAALIIEPVAAPQALGVTVLASTFFIVLTFALTQLSEWSQRLGAPLITVPILAAVAFSAADLNDNHRIRRVDGAPEVARVGDAPTEADLCADGIPFKSTTPGQCRAGDAFRQWLLARADLQRFVAAGEPYPVYIVAAQGGGAFAANHTVQFLRRAQASCERFNQHLFAISGVSGGAVGAAFYAAQAKAYSQNVAGVECPPTPPSFRETTAGAQLGAAFVAQDFLSPVLASMMFADLFQRLLPYPLEALSRARSLEAAIEAAWPAAHAAEGLALPQEPNPMAAGVLALWDPAAATPALLLNATEAGTGRRRVIAPFHFGAPESDLRFFPLSRAHDVPLSVAAALSARFPWITPAGWFVEPDETGEALRKVRVVDGGYFENSGVATALELIEDIEAAQRADATLPEFVVNLIVLTSSDFPKRGAYGLSEAAEPLRALLAARQARTPIEIARAEARLAQTAPGAAPRLRRVPLGDLITAMPLGWRLSGTTRLQIALQSGDASACAPDRLAAFEGGRPLALAADCVQWTIFRELSGASLGAAPRL